MRTCGRACWTLGLLIGLSTMPSTAFAQLRLWGEFGEQRIRFGDWQRHDNRGVGAGFDFTAGERSTRGAGLVLALGDEIRSDTGFDFADNLTFLDVNFRFGRVTLGPGVNYLLIDRADALDSRCKISDAQYQQYLANVAAGAPRASCADRVVGTRSLGYVEGLAPSGNLKVRFGPGGRGFVQARVMGYPPDSVKIHDKRSPPASNYPRLDNAWDARVSAGFSVGSGFVKAQFSGRDLIFLRTFGNTNEMYDESERQFTLGMGLTF